MGNTKNIKQRKKEELSIPIMIICIVGVVLTVFGLMLLKSENFKLKVISTQGTVTGVQTKTTADGVVESRAVNLSYQANKSDYNATIPNYDKEIEIGGTMTLYYDFLSPQNVSNKRSGYIGYIAAFLGIILTIKTGPRFIRIIKDNYL